MIEETRTPKAEQTRTHILEVALTLFLSQGYEATTMRDIAAAADCSLGLTYRYYAAKEELVFALYSRMAAETNAEIARLPQTSVAERFYQTMVNRLHQVTPYRDSIGALFGAAANPQSPVNLFGEAAAGLRQQTYQAFLHLVQEAKNPPRESQDIATLLYAAHFGVILFWLIDRSPDQARTYDLLDFIRHRLSVPQQVITLLFAASGLSRLAAIIRPIMVGPAQEG